LENRELEQSAAALIASSIQIICAASRQTPGFVRAQLVHAWETFLWRADRPNLGNIASAPSVPSASSAYSIEKMAQGFPD
jgi:hypothetical protein